MQEKTGLAPEHALEVRQEAWDLSPCRACTDSPCCTVLPLAAMRLSSRMDFMNLALLACYGNIRLLRKKRGEWTVYYAKNCGALDRDTSQCLIHGSPDQNMICKTYDAHTCWYGKAFRNTQNEEVIFFNLERLFLLDRITDVFRRSGDTGNASWDDIGREMASIPCPIAESSSQVPAAVLPLLLPFNKCQPENFLLFPPFGKPQREIHFELAAFRLGFPGVRLLITDTHWAYLVHTALNRELFTKLTKAYFPSLAPHHGCFAFPELHKQMDFFSETGRNCISLNRGQLPLLRSAVRYDAFGNVKSIPSTRELLSLLRPSSPLKPDKAA